MNKKKFKGENTTKAGYNVDETSSTVSGTVGDSVVASKKKDNKGKKGMEVMESEINGTVESQSEENWMSAQVVANINLEPDDGDVLLFTGKKRGKKGKQTVSKISGDGDVYAISATNELEELKLVKEAGAVQVVPSKEETPSGVAAGEDLRVTSKKKKKEKKVGRIVQEEEDLDAILAELDGPKIEKAVGKEKPEVPDVHAQPQSDSVEVTNLTSVSGLTESEEVVESAAAKKKKKKKEKEKAKSAVAEKHEEAIVEEQKDQRPNEPAKSKAADKKVPKHVREMQERLAKLQEAAEKRQREEEEKRRKEEEEQRRLEELERQKEEAKRRRKEREKEKLHQKKLEGKLLTGKKKEEARRLAMMREQFLANKGMSGEGDLALKDEISVPRKPKYETKKKKRLPVADAVPLDDSVSQAEDAQELDLLAAEVVDEAIAEIVSEGSVELAQEEKMDVVEEEAEEEEEDWDAKSFEENINLPAIKSAFAEEEDDSKPSSTTEKHTRHVVAQASVKRPTSPSKQTSTVKHSQWKLPQSSEEIASEEETESEDDTEVKRRRDYKEKREARKADALKNRSADDLRSPICCILGHVDTGKTKLLDCIRRTNVQEGEAGGITQQIGATYFPMDNIRERTKELKADAKLRVPGLLVIDTPGHESFTNLRARGSSLCDIAILVIDIMHGLEPQTIESLNLLKSRQTPFVVALNKVDRLYGWKPSPGAPIRAALKQQSKDVVSEFDMRLSQIMTELKEQGMNSELYYRNKELRKYISIIPTSAISGEGIPDLLMLLVQLTQKLMEDKLMYMSEVQCTVLEVKVVEGLGTTIDVVLVNGVLHEGDQIVVCGMQGPIVTTVRALLTPHPMKELRVKGTYLHHKELKAAQGIKITAQGLEHAIAGTQLYVVGPDDELEDIKEEAMQDMKSVMSRVDKSGEGVCVQASTLGSLEALLEFLKSPAVKIPVSGISIGPVHKKDVMRASVMLEKKKKEYATILAFDVKVTPEAKELAEELGVKIFMADIIYHLFDQFTAYMNNVKDDKRKDAAEEAVFPCVLKILPQHIFNKKDPIVVGVDVLEGVAKVGTPLCVPSRENIDIGRIASLEINHKIVDTAKKGQSVAMKIVGTNPEETQKMFGRHFDEEDELVSRITRRSIDLLKENYRDDLTIEEWRLVVKLKKLFEIA
ncbi:hypothetical protein O6H91_01G170900 [Diphasiastrum complanatum]|uniref:Uncharacterized protein n=3 Tax=Diphasiastrum complanatum TaxID=34168 RepID=A0ACC2EYU1_DIPCM|nr:hypothetical protein O6H91_01G170900 [Diphasiastrum complanatum]KAJ7571662.1 hypothetical protein O6H91_01G170900 [Diphasiastrum complanatum]